MQSAEKILIHELAQRIKEGTSPQYLLEDCFTQQGVALFKRGKRIQAPELKQLIQAGFYYIWVSTGSPKMEMNNFSYNLKLELSRTLGKVMVPIDELEGKKPTSKVHYLEKNDLLRQILEVIQLEGTSYLAEKIFGYSFRQLLSIQSTIKNNMVQSPSKVELTDHICLGNEYKQSTQKEKELQNQTIYASNFVTRNMIHMALGYMVTLLKISKLREKLQAPSFIEEDMIKRPSYDKNEVREAILSALFCKYGLLHWKIQEILNRHTQSFLDPKGNIQGSGITYLNSNNQLIVEKYCNVSHHFFASMKQKGFVQNLGRGILHYHNQRLNGLGYPWRKYQSTKITVKNEWAQSYEEKKDLFDKRILEPTRLAGIIAFFVDSLFQSPLHLPFKRDSLVRHMLLNSYYSKDPRTQEPDKSGILEIMTHYRQEKAFDGFLVEEFLGSIHLYKIGELVPVYHFKNFHQKVYDAQIIDYNPMPHRPIILILSDGEKKGKQIDLSHTMHENLYLGEYTPCLDFQDVLDEFFEEKLNHGILTREQLLERQKFQKLPKTKREIQEKIDALWEDESLGTEDIDEQKDHSVSSVDKLIAMLPSQLKPSGTKDSYHLGTYQKSHSQEEEISNEESPREEVAREEISNEESEKTQYSILNYIEAKDPRKPNGSKEKVPKYIVEIKASEKSIVTFLYYIQKKDGKNIYIKDRNCGKKFDLRQLPFFELGPSISKGGLE